MVRGCQTFKEFQESGESIATNVLSERLNRLAAAGVIESELAPDDARRIHYRLTEKGIDLAPVLLEMLLWGARHERTGAPAEVMENLAANRRQVLLEVRRRWRQRDRTPFLPNFKQVQKRRTA